MFSGTSGAIALRIADRLFFSAGVLIPLARDGNKRHWLTRAKASAKWRRVKRLGPGDELVAFTVSAAARRQDPSLPETWLVRAIRYQRWGFRPQTLLTSMLDPAEFPAAEVRKLYHESWEIELGYDEIKTEMLEREEAIRSRTPDGVRQETEPQRFLEATREAAAVRCSGHRATLLMGLPASDGAARPTHALRARRQDAARHSEVRVARTLLANAWCCTVTGWCRWD